MNREVKTFPFGSPFRGLVDPTTYCHACGLPVARHEALTTALTEIPDVGLFGVHGELACGTWSGDRAGDDEARALRDALRGKEVRIGRSHR